MTHNTTACAEPAVAVPAVPVRGLTASAYRIPTDAPEADGTFAWDATTLVVVRAEAGGRQGLGWTYGSAAGVRLVDEVLTGAVTGRCALDVPAAYLAMCRAVRNIGRPGLAATAISAADIALWDLKARLLGVRLAGLLGAVHDAAPVYGSGGFTSYDDRRLDDQLCTWVADLDIRRVKIKIGEAGGTRPGRDLARVRQARAVVGLGVDLYVDANGAYGRKQAVRLAHRFADADVSWFEEPVSSDDLDGLRAVRDAVAPDVAAGEYGYDLAYFQRMCAARAVDCLQVDATRCGGVTEWLRAAAVAAAHHLDVSAHCAPHAHLDAALAIPNLRHLEWFHDHARIESLLFDGALTPERGRLVPDRGLPGHGLSFREADAERYRIA